jgi:hypothetical protein
MILFLFVVIPVVTVTTLLVIWEVEKVDGENTL